MTDPVQPNKIDPETLVLRAKPRRVVRFKRNVLVGAAAIGCLALVGVTWLGLQGPNRKPTESKELYDPDKGTDTQKPKPDQFQSLPTTYADLPAGVPQLGPPLPGDLGKPLLEAQKARALSAPYPAATPENRSHDSGVFVQVSNRGASAAPAAFASLGDAGLTGTTSIATDPGGGQSPDQNGQEHKLAFMKAASTGSVYNPHSLQTPASPYQVMAGTVISASLVTGLNSDLPGMVIAQLTEPLYDSVSGRFLLAPQGTRLIGEYDSVIAFGQSRALVVWKRMILPDGSSLEIENLPATDASGYAGLADKVDYHTWSLLKGVGLSTLLGLTAMSGSDDDSDLVKALRESTRETANQAGQRIIDKAINVQPSITVRPGWPLRVIVHKDLILRPYQL